MIVDNLFENSINLLSNFFTSCIVSLNAKFLFFCYFFHEMDCKKHNILHKLSFPFIYENFIALILEGKKDVFHDTDFWHRFVLVIEGAITLKQFNILNGSECQFFILMLHLSWNGLQKTWHSSKSFFSLDLWKFHCFDFGRGKKNIFLDSVLLT